MASQPGRPLTGPGHEERAQELANQGQFVVIVCENPDPQKSGHIVVVRPSDKPASALGKEGPQVAHVGGKNRNSTTALSAFSFHPGSWPDGVNYYWHAVDWSALTARDARNSAKP